MNSAVTFFGKSLERAMDGVEKKNAKATEIARQRVLDRWLDRELKYRSVSPGMAHRQTTENNAGPTASAEDEEVTFSFSGDGGGV